MRRLLVIFIVLFLAISSQGQEHSVARQWNEMLLESIRNDFARPTVHARNLFHLSAAMYDAWATYEPEASTYFLGKTVHGFNTPFAGVATPSDVQAAQEEAISYAAYRLLIHRFNNSPGRIVTIILSRELMEDLGYDVNVTTTDYENFGPAALGNYIAEKIIEFGLQDGSNEAADYENQFYVPVNDPFRPDQPGNPTLTDPDRWQPLEFEEFVDQSGNPISGGIPTFLGPEWGAVLPFALQEDDLTIYNRDGDEYWVYHDPGDPALFAESHEEYVWNHSLVALWSSHLDPTDGVLWDISPAASGNFPADNLPTTLIGLRDFYNELEGGDPSTGHDINPVTNAPYEPNLVPRGDYTRVLAEFWADGPDSETPPGHWFTILNYVNDHPQLEKRYRGEGPVLDDLEWDVKSYFLLGGAMHDAAITAWGVKGYYDYIRPISALRYLGELGQKTDPDGLSYDPNGIELVPGFIELVEEGDPLADPAGDGSNLDVGKIKVMAWKGPDFIVNPATDQAGVDWILLENWWPYQRPTFVTPPFAGYVSGHSTYSRAAAEALTALTGTPYFPGGVGEFFAPQNEFLVFEEGPSVDVTLQWATYRDASDQTSLSRIWGGIHPPVDDIPGRLMGIELAQDAFALADSYFNPEIVGLEAPLVSANLNVFPNPVAVHDKLKVQLLSGIEPDAIQLYDLQGRTQAIQFDRLAPGDYQAELNGVSSGSYLLVVSTQHYTTSRTISILR